MFFLFPSKGSSHKHYYHIHIYKFKVDRPWGEIEEINRISGKMDGGNCISMYRGDFKTLELTVTDENGVYDLTGCTLNFYMKKKVTDYDTNALISKSSNQASEIKITDLTNGLAEI